MNTTLSIRITNHIIRELENAKVHSFRIPVTSYWWIGRCIILLAKRKKLEERELTQALANALMENSYYFPLAKIKGIILLYKYWPILKDLPTQLSWSHFVCLTKLSERNQRHFYQQQCMQEHWSARELKRQIRSQYFQRSISALTNRPFKDHYILEFTNMEMQWKEVNLETQLLQKIEETLLEMGKGFSFLARQKRIATPSGSLFFVDLLFFNSQLNAHVLVDLKRGPLSYKDIGQMDVYLRIFNALVRKPNESEAFGLILCPSFDNSLLEYSILKEQAKMKVATYSFQFP